MSKSFRIALLAAVATSTFAGVAHAQDLTEPPRRRQGYYLSVGYGSGASQAWEDDKALGVWQTGHLALRAGQLITRRLGLGIVIDSGASIKAPITRSVFGIGVEGQAELGANFAARASIGFGALQIIEEDKVRDKTTLTGTYGTQYGLGLSYDWFPFSKRSGGFAVTPVFEVRSIPRITTGTIGGFIGIELGYWTGLPRNQLELPESEAYR
jgi:hypothetical protein